MKQTERLARILQLLTTYSLVPILANLLTLFFQVYVEEKLSTGAEANLPVPVLSAETIALTRILPFPVLALTAFIYVLPVIVERLSGKARADVPRRAAERMFRAPLVVGFLGFSGWFFAVLLTIAVSASTGREMFTEEMGLLILDDLLHGSLSFVLTYFPMDYLGKHWIVPGLLPDGKLSAYASSLSGSIRSRFLVYFYAIGVFPAITLVYQLVLRLPGSQEAYIIGYFSAVVALGLSLTLLVSRSFSWPINEMRKATGRILAGDFDIRLPVVSVDELGTLSESVNHMADGLREKEFIKNTFGRMVDPAVRDHLLSGKISLGGELSQATVLFTDIRGFTALSERTPPDLLVDLLNRYFERMSAAVREEGGFVNKYIGDAVMAVFGLPIPLGGHALRALACARKMIRYRDELNHELEAEGLAVIQTGIGIHTGSLLSGNIGSPERLEYTVIGDTVNTASRIEGATRKAPTDLLFSAEVARAIHVEYGAVTVRIGRFKLKGKNDHLDLFSLRDLLRERTDI